MSIVPQVIESFLQIGVLFLQIIVLFLQIIVLFLHIIELFPQILAQFFLVWFDGVFSHGIAERVPLLMSKTKKQKRVRKQSKEIGDH